MPVDWILNSIVKSYNIKKNTHVFFSLSVISTLLCAISSSLHYTKKFYGNHLTWISWIMSIIFLIIAFVPSYKKNSNSKNGKSDSLIIKISVFGLLTIFFIVSHLWNFKTAPWNQNGLFDDAAWNVYYALRYIFSGQPFQSAFFDHGIAREVLFHYYITFAFKIFGYNLLTFNIAVMILGCITYLFTALLIYKLFNNYLVTIISAIMLNFFPLHFLFCFVGQRYTMVPPFLMSSLFFLYKGYKEKSYFSIALSSILAGLCFSAGIMGKQYLMGLAGGLVLFIVFNFKKSFTKINYNMLKLFCAGFVIGAMPMLMYILYNQSIYFANESNYSKLFIETLRTQGFDGFMKYFNRMTECLFGFSYEKWFIPDFPLIPLHYYVFLIVGFIIAFIKKQYHLITIGLVPPVGAFVSGFSDYRVLMAAPVWVVLMAFALNQLLTVEKKIKYDLKNLVLLFKELNYKLISIGLAFAIFIAGVIPCIKYLNEKSKDPFSVHFFAQKDVAISRFIRDIVAGVPEPSTDFRKQEFRKLKDYSEPNYDTLVCQNLGFAITHTFLIDYNNDKTKDYNRNQILAFSNQLPYDLIEPDEIFQFNKIEILDYKKNDKDLKMVWEITPKVEKIISKFKELKHLGTEEILSSHHLGNEFSFYVLTISNNNIDEFKAKVSEMTY